ncbi:MAG: histidinol dehydrogenase [Asticcacaulis sp.]
MLEGVPPADKIYGPGNKYVAEAKRYATERVSGLAIDMPAGPSELLVIADDTADVKLVAADLLSQAEHDADAQVLLVALSEGIAARITTEVALQVERLPRAAIAKASLGQARVFIVSGIEEAAQVSNLYGPRAPGDPGRRRRRADPHADRRRYHLRRPLCRAKPSAIMRRGRATSCPPTARPRRGDGITVRSFLTSFVVQKATREGAAAIAPAAARLARLEGLEAPRPGCRFPGWRFEDEASKKPLHHPPSLHWSISRSY